MPIKGWVEVDEAYCKACELCVNACPCHALKGRQWNIKIHRHKLIDYKLCNKERSKSIPIYHKKNA